MGSLLLAIVLFASPQTRPVAPQQIAFIARTPTHDIDHQKGDLYTCDLDGKHVRLIEKNVDQSAQGFDVESFAPGLWDSISWSPSGKYLSFYKDHVVLQPARLFLTERRTKTTYSVTTGKHWSDEFLSWKDDTHLYVRRWKHEGAGSVFEISVPRMTSTPITSKETLSPNGRIAAKFVGRGEDILNLENRVTRKVVRATNDSIDNETEAVWSADSKWIALQTFTITKSKGSVKIFVASTFDKSKSVVINGGASDFLWSPDNRRLAFLYQDDDVPTRGTSTIAVLDVKTKHMSILRPECMALIAWTADGKSIVGIDSTPSGSDGIYLIPLQGKRKLVLSRASIGTVRVSGYRRFATVF